LKIKPLSSPKVLPDGRISVWPQFTAIAKHEADEDLDREFEVEMDIQVDRWGRGRCSRLEVRVPNGQSVSSTLLRAIPVPRLVAQATAEAGSVLQCEDSLPEGGARFSGLTAGERAATYKKLMEGAREPRRGAPITDAHLEQVAAVYRQAAEVDDPPLKAIEEQFEAKRATASKWVRMARDRGILGPALRGRAGEASPREV
jgi:hypothetical protein